MGLLNTYYSTYSRWINIEIELAKELNKKTIKAIHVSFPQFL